MSEAAIDVRENATVSFRPNPAFAIATALGCSVAMTWPQAMNVWTTGAFGDTDDAMRMVQVRDLLAGQNWFDMAQHRLAPPEGSFMHWSRVVDIPLAALMKIFGLLLAPAQAEAATRLAFPLLLLVCLYAAVAHAARLFGGRAVQIAAVGLAFATAPFLAQFVPGRIDHHAPQIVLLMLASGAVLAALDASRAKAMWAAAACIALSLAISLENLPFFVVLAAIPVVAWVARGADMAPALRVFALGLMLALPLCFVATVGPSRWTNTACDADSAAYLMPGLAGAVGLLALASFGGKLTSIAARSAGALALSIIPLAVLKLIAPACFNGPFVGLDPLVRTVWLEHVAEVQKLHDLGAAQPAAALMLGAPLALALVSTFAMAALSRGLQRARLLALGALIAIGLLMTFWAVRAFSSVAPLAMIGAAVAVVALAQRVLPAGPLRPALSALLCLPFAPITYALALPSVSQDDGSRTAACLQPAAVAPLDAAPAGLVLAPIDEGAHLLAFTHHSVVAAPYHRNNAGNRLSIDAFLATPDEARKIVAASGADYLVSCPLMRRMRTMATRAPQGLAAELIAGRVPDWLEPMAIEAKPNAIYRIVR